MLEGRPQKTEISIEVVGWRCINERGIWVKPFNRKAFCSPNCFWSWRFCIDGSNDIILRIHHPTHFWINYIECNWLFRASILFKADNLYLLCPCCIFSQSYWRLGSQRIHIVWKTTWVCTSQATQSLVNPKI